VSGNRIKVFFCTFLDLVLLQILDRIPEKLVFAKSVFDPDLEFFCLFQPLPWKLTSLYQKRNSIAILKHIGS